MFHISRLCGRRPPLSPAVVGALRRECYIFVHAPRTRLDWPHAVPPHILHQHAPLTWSSLPPALTTYPAPPSWCPPTLIQTHTRAAAPSSYCSSSSPTGPSSTRVCLVVRSACTGAVTASDGSLPAVAHARCTNLDGVGNPLVGSNPPPTDPLFRARSSSVAAMPAASAPPLTTYKVRSPVARSGAPPGWRAPAAPLTGAPTASRFSRTSDGGGSGLPSALPAFRDAGAAASGERPAPPPGFQLGGSRVGKPLVGTRTSLSPSVGSTVTAASSPPSSPRLGPVKDVPPVQPLPASAPGTASRAPTKRPRRRLARFFSALSAPSTGGGRADRGDASAASLKSRAPSTTTLVPRAADLPWTPAGRQAAAAGLVEMRGRQAGGKAGQGGAARPSSAGPRPSTASRPSMVGRSSAGPRPSLASSGRRTPLPAASGGRVSPPAASGRRPTVSSGMDARRGTLTATNVNFGDRRGTSAGVAGARRGTTSGGAARRGTGVGMGRVSHSGGRPVGGRGVRV